MNQPLIGSFTIPIGELIHSIKLEREREIEEIEEVLEGLRKIISGEIVIPSYSIKNEVSLNRDSETTSIKNDNSALILAVKE
jgi:hypothetical protein